MRDIIHQLLQLKKNENGVRFTNSAHLGRFRNNKHTGTSQTNITSFIRTYGDNKDVYQVTTTMFIRISIILLSICILSEKR
jgi:hypothetical protein